jgi:23S rRNA (cytosine1962-C5)-methyltransferase
MNFNISKYVQLKKGKEGNIRRKHPWIFSGALHETHGQPEDGDLVRVLDHQQEVLGFGHFHQGSITVKMLHFGPEEYYSGFWYDRLELAWRIRAGLNLFRDDNNAFRWVHGEGDGLPGLIIDVYGLIVVIQCHTIGMHRQIQSIKEAILMILDAGQYSIVDKSKETLPVNYAASIQNRSIHGDRTESHAMENGFRFVVDCIGGQKTGFFLDQRENRNLLSQYALNKSVLNAYCYSGGFSIYALGHGAKQVVSVDVSKKALELLNQNLLLNKMENHPHEMICTDVHQFLEHLPHEQYDVIILDPPAFAKSMAKRHTAIQAYKRINTQAMRKIKSGGLLFTFSCSQVVTEDLFYHTIVSAGIDSGRTIRLLKRLSQGPDHPVSLFHPEGSYLKGFVLWVE